MWILLAVLVIGVFLFGRDTRLEASATEGNDHSAIRAYVDGKPVKAYLKE